MPIVVFQNYRTVTLRLVIGPGEESHEVPHLAEVGMRYTLDDGAEDRSTSVVTDDRIEFWCNAQNVEVDVVHASPYQKLLWSLCVELGFCGGIVNGEPTHVSDLLPADGLITAKAFADLAIRAEGGWATVEEGRLRWGDTLEAKFIEHMGGAVVPVKTLKEISRRPFDSPDPD
jgi:hypothetical protein